MVMKRIVGWFAEKIGGGPPAQFDKANARPFAAQEETLRRILRGNAGTEFGARHAFQRLGGLSGTELWKTFRKEVPVQDHAAFLPAIERMKAGETIPGGSASLKEYARQRFIWMQHIHKSHPSIAEGKYLALASPAETIMNLPDAEQRWFHTLLFAMTEENIRAVEALNPGSLIELAKRLDRDAERLLASMENGLPAAKAPAEPSLPNPARARELREIRRANGALTPADVWPNLQLLVTWQGGPSKFFLPHVTALWGDVAMRCPGLRCAEGVFSIPLRDNDASGVLAVDSHVMEFLPADGDAGVAVRPDAPTLLAGQLEEGRLYRLIVTTQGGLYRCDTGDLLRVTGFRKRTPEVRFERRADAVLSAAGETLTEDQLVSAMEIAAANGPLLNGFTCTCEPAGDGAARYVLALECTGGGDLSGGRGKRLRGRLEQLLSVLDFELMKNNAGYNERRQDGRLAFPGMALLAEGSYERLRARSAAGGGPESRLKQPTLAAPGTESSFFEQMPVAAKL